MDVLDRAQQRIATLNSTVQALRLQRESIDAQLAKYERELTKLLGFVDTYRELNAETDTPDSPRDGGESSISRPKGMLTPRNIEVIAEAYLRDAAPKKTSELVDYLEEKGCQIPSQRKEAYLAGILSRSKKFVARRKHGGWFLAENDPARGLPIEQEEIPLELVSSGAECVTVQQLRDQLMAKYTATTLEDSLDSWLRARGKATVWAHHTKCHNLARITGEKRTAKSETPSVGAEGVSDTSTQAAVEGGTESDGLI